MIEAIKEVLKGIDQTELESTDGWWETSAGAEFGAKKLKYIIGLLAQPEQEPVALQMDVIVVNLVREGINKHRARELAEHFIKHTTPPQRTWVGLTDEERLQLYLKSNGLEFYKNFAMNIEAKLKEKNT